jgi:uncharacterized protein (DUF983 family)
MTTNVETATIHAKLAGARNVWTAMGRGLRNRCPACGQGVIFGKFLKVDDRCGACGTELHHHRADDAPPYFTMLIVGHVVGGGVLSLEQYASPPMWLHAAIWFPLTIILSLVLLPRIKGALIGLQWAHRMHGFGGEPDRAEADPAAAVVGEIKGKT